MNKSESLTCKICNKYYSSKSSLCNHNKKFHSEISQNVNNSQYNVNTNVNNCHYNVNNSQIKCNYCDKIFSSRQSKSLHIKKYCKKKINEEEQNILREENKKRELELQIKKEEAQILKLKLKLQNSDKVDNITLKRLNKMLLKHNNRIKNSTINTNSNNTTNIQNNIVNNYQIIGFGKEENIDKLLTNQEKSIILNSRLCCLEKLIEIVHCGKYNQFKNIIVTNIKDNYIYKYDESKGMFVLSNKNDVLHTLVDYRLDDLEVIYHEFIDKNKIDEKTKNCIEKFINRINTDDKYFHADGEEYDSYKQYKINEIKMLLFNNQDKITNDISLLLSAEEISVTDKS